jgi:hypothetical protein
VNERTLRPANIAAAAAVIGGVLVVLLPRHAMSIAQVVIVTIGAGAGLQALILNAPPTWWRSPFDRSVGSSGQTRPVFDETSWIRAVLSGRRQKIPNGPPLPPETLRVLQPLIRTALERQGIDPDDRRSRTAARTRLSATTLAILIAKPAKRATWLDTLRPDAHETARVVHDVLDELDRLDGRTAERTLTPTERRST